MPEPTAHFRSGEQPKHQQVNLDSALQIRRRFVKPLDGLAPTAHRGVCQAEPVQ